MFESISRGWALTKTSFKVLSLDKEIVALPILSAVVLILAVVGLGAGALGIGALDGSGLLTYVLLFGVYVIAYAIVIFFNAAVIEMATIRFNGGNPTLKDGLRKAWSRAGRILQWAVVAATVGLIFRALRDRARDNFLAQMLVSFLEFGWNVAVYFAVPVLVYQDVGPFEAIKRSMQTVKRTWGEELTGMATTGFVFFVLGLIGIIPLFIGLNLLGAGAVVVGFAFIAIAVVYWILLAAVNSAVDGILTAALYKYSVDGRLPQAFADTGIDPQALAW